MENPILSIPESRNGVEYIRSVWGGPGIFNPPGFLQFSDTITLYLFAHFTHQAASYLAHGNALSEYRSTHIHIYFFLRPIEPDTTYIHNKAVPCS